ncbi:hypothetical protein LOTGIDRAFT_173946 [Lottia gigantea]|uniref:PDZ domain-containing protein 8 n=1 Tax=Lottia gigantea TaxID=225164 RepID=V4A5A8_LOTGI|nr:hypothetical protein LOTGIDRAFT_173946 [Lottia gigantea]ESO99108.1 hypothetical protein LOTGIDRAFT_173946 [Lottia gigantea]
MNVKTVKILKEKLQDKEELEKKQSCLWFNILSQYLFQELRDTPQVRRFVMKKMNKEFEEVLQTTSGKFLDQIIIRDFNLGTTFPIVNNVSIKNIVKNGDKLEEIDLGLDVDYDGGFQIALDVFLVFNKSAYLSVTLKKLKGYARLQLTRTPYTHWSFSFYDDPEVDFAVESQFEGRQLPQVANIIITQLRRSIRKKHTLPNYKMRFRPFFFQQELEKPLRDLTVNGHNITTGRLDIQVKECSRLLKTPKDSFLYCSVSIDYLPYKELVNSRRRVWVTHDIEVNKNNAQSVGLAFKEEQLLDRYETAVIVEFVIPDSPAAIADIRKGDMLIAIGTTKISSTKQAAKLIKTAGEKFMVRLERTQIKMNPDLKFVEENINVKESAEFEFSEESAVGDNNGEEFISISFKQDGEEPKIKMSHDKPKTTINQSPPTHQQKPRSKTDLTVDGTPVLKKRSIGSESPASSFKRESSPHGLRYRTHSDPGQLTKLINDDVDSVHSTETDGGTVSDSDDDVSTVQKTKEVKSSQNPKWNHAMNFDITEQLRYLNLCIWCKIPEKTDKSEKVIKPERHLLVGHVNIPLSDLCLECLLTLEGQTKYKVNLLPGEMKATASRSKTGKYMNLPGFDSQLCYGDVTLIVKFNNNNLNENERQTITKVPLDPSVVTDTNRDTTINKAVDEVTDINHHFNGAQFPSATYCNFCGKKIWLKVAFQCKQCSMICHKKCVEKCQADTLCTKNGVKCRSKPDTEWKMPVVTSRLKKVQEYKEGVTKSKLLSKFRKEDKPSQQQQQTPVKKNVPTSLDINVNTDSDVKMSPGITPSPRFSPRLLRKVPKVVLEAGDSTTKVLQDDPPSDDSDAEQNAALQELYEKRAKGQNLDEMVVTAAKQMGRELFTHLSITERKNKLDHMVSKLQLEIDQETENKSDLNRTLHETLDQGQRQAIQQHLLKSEEKGDALMMLLLHYCAGLQHCLDQEQEERLKNEGELNEGELNVEELENCVGKEEDIYVSTEDLLFKMIENGHDQFGDMGAVLIDKSDAEESDSDDFEKFRVLDHQIDDGELI